MITAMNGANITSAVRMLDNIHVRCVSHTLQLGVAKDWKLPAVVKGVACCKFIVTHLHH